MRWQSRLYGGGSEDCFGGNDEGSWGGRVRETAQRGLKESWKIEGQSWGCSRQKEKARTDINGPNKQGK